MAAPDIAPVIVSRDKHSISRKGISDSALKVLYRLHENNYAAYIVGGGVRDLLLNKQPKDFDVATNATPEQIKSLFGNCRLIGRRFRLAHIHFGRDIVEVATFRGHHNDDHADHESLLHNGMLVRDNVYGTLEEDAWRRDFSINAIYYNIADFSLVDYTGGLDDLTARRIRLIGDAQVRLQEDPVRMLRAVRFAAKLDFHLDAVLAEQIPAQAQRIAAVPPARLFDEVLKMFISGYAVRIYELLQQYGVFQEMFAQTAHSLLADPRLDGFIRQALHNTDQRLREDKPVTPAFLFATLLWGPVRDRAQQLQQQKMSRIQSIQEAASEVLAAQSQLVAIPKRLRLPIREIWISQARLHNRRGKRPYWLLGQKRFRAAYDFMLLRHEAGETQLTELCEWWTRFQEVSDKERQQMCKALSPRSRQSHRKG